MDGTEPSDDLKKGEASRPPPFFALCQIVALDHLIFLLNGMAFIVDMISHVSGNCRLLSIASICCRVLPEYHIYFDDE